MDLKSILDGLFPKTRWTFPEEPMDFSRRPDVLFPACLKYFFYRQSPDGLKVHPGWTLRPSGMDFLIYEISL